MEAPPVPDLLDTRSCSTPSAETPRRRDEPAQRRISSMPEREISSLDRFITRHAPMVLEVMRARVLGIVGGIYGAFGLVMLLVGLGAALVGHQAVVVAIPGAVFGATGGIMLGLRRLFQRSAPPEYATHVDLTPEAKALAVSLATHLFGWPLGPRLKRLRWRRRLGGRAATGLRPGRRCQDLLSPPAFRLLEAAARECNRIHGVVSMDLPRGSGLRRLAPAVRAAALETMAELFHTAALIEATPENAGALESEAGARVRELGELAAQVERLHGEAMSEEAQVDGPTRIQALLQELHADERARGELATEGGGVEERRVRVSG